MHTRAAVLPTATLFFLFLQCTLSSFLLSGLLRFLFVRPQSPFSGAIDPVARLLRPFTSSNVVLFWSHGEECWHKLQVFYHPALANNVPGYPVQHRCGRRPRCLATVGSSLTFSAARQLSLASAVLRCRRPRCLATVGSGVSKSPYLSRILTGPATLRWRSSSRDS